MTGKIHIYATTPLCLCELCPAAAVAFHQGKVYCASHYHAVVGPALRAQMQESGYEPPRMIRGKGR